jgi:hypothetical protein
LWLVWAIVGPAGLACRSEFHDGSTGDETATAECDARYGDVPGYVACSTDEPDECRFAFVGSGELLCAELCPARGGDCVAEFDALNTEEDACTTTKALACGEEGAYKNWGVCACTAP